jgi:hypothetical protein
VIALLLASLFQFFFFLPVHCFLLHAYYGDQAA